ncbi:MAG: sulfite exporter TauE/SafE family protein [Alphaproteobacteria bacterium]|jgi:hypothetical protein|nr:sulfite exporter TauE/SafE family protein [Alphaproteobacteria bacterium]HJP22663.1 sulfite exporter TauE/SafE family protein [Alphaproteobacteria bacterium]
MWTVENLVVVGAIFLLAGFVKGVVGLGLPTVALALVAATLGLKQGMALMLIPAIATNIWQGLSGGALREVLRRLWLFLLASGIGVWFGVGVLAEADANLMSGLLGVVLVCYAGFSLVTPQIPEPGRFERWLSPPVGLLAGFMAGLTGSYMVPGALYLQALRLPRDVLVQTLGVAFTTTVLVLSAALARHDILTWQMAALSTLALAPAFAGMAVGRRLRLRLPEPLFRKVFFSAVLLLGIYIVGRVFF